MDYKRIYVKEIYITNFDRKNININNKTVEKVYE